MGCPVIAVLAPPPPPPCQDDALSLPIGNLYTTFLQEEAERFGGRGNPPTLPQLPQVGVWVSPAF